MKKAIGGFFELEKTAFDTAVYHPEALFLNTGRACLNLLIKQQRIEKLFVPFYTCDALITPVQVNNIVFQFYNINKNLEPIETFSLDENEYLVYVNYFGLCDETVIKLKRIYGDKLIVDNSQSFFTKGDNENFSFNTARKFFGIPDGAYLYGLKNISTNLTLNKSISTEHLVLRLEGKQYEAYLKFVEYEKSLNTDIFIGSAFSSDILKRINYEDVAMKRKQNFMHYHLKLKDYNQLKFEIHDTEVPFAYPYLPSKPLDRTRLYAQNIFIPTLWRDVMERKGKNYNFERKISDELLPLPVDQRYSEDDIDFVINSLISLS